MSALTDSGTFQITNIWQPSTTLSCAVNKGGAVITLLFWNHQVRPIQVFFYQLILGGGCGPQLDPASCGGSAKTDTPSFWLPGKPITNAAGKVIETNFGMNDFLSQYGYTRITDTNPHLTLQMLPRLTAIIEQGSYGMDPNIAHWTLGGEYYGQIIGGIGLSTQWTGFIPMITPAPGVLAAKAANP